MAKKENAKMTPEVNEVPAVNEVQVANYKLVETKQKQSVLNLETNDDSEIVVITQKITWLPFETEVDGKKVSTEPTTEEKMRALDSLISPEDKKVIALEKFFTAESYNESKKAALAAGNYLTQQLRSAIVGLMQQNAAFSELSAKDCYDRWMKGYKEGKKGPKDFLERAKATLETTDFDF